MSLKEILPPVKSNHASFYDHSNDMWFKNLYNSSEKEKSLEAKRKPVPPYLKRQGFVPRKIEDFGDGGAFPEIHIGQYPLDMGRNKSGKPGSKNLPVSVDAHGSVAYDAIVKQNENSKKIVYSQHKDLIPKFLRNDEEEEETDEEMQREIDETTQETKACLEKVVNVKLSAAQPKNVPQQSSDSKYIKYKPSQQSVAFNSGAKERVIRMMEMPVDPLEPPKFKHKRVPRASGSPPVPVMHSPPRPVTVKDQQDWKIPPCISNWKNPKGYTIPLDKRLAADGRGLQDVQINDNFAKLSEALYVAEQKAREAVAMRSKVQKEMLMKEKERKEQELRALAQKARSERTGAAPPASVPIPSEKSAMDTSDMREDYEQERERGRERDMPKETREEREERLQREKLRAERRRERERERRLEAKDAAMGKKSKITRDRDRDISEKFALGMASTGAARGGEVMYDQRLFNQEKGMDSGFATDDQYNVYDKGLFTAQPTLSTLYRPKKDADDDMYGGNADEQMEKIMKTDRFKPDKGFAGSSERSGPRDRPVEFEKEAEEADPFGLDEFLTEVKKGGKKALDKVGTGGPLPCPTDLDSCKKMATAARLRYHPMASSSAPNTQVPNFTRQSPNFPYRLPNNPASFSQNHSLRILHSKVSPPRFELSSTGGGGNYGTGHGKGGGGGGGDGSGGFSGDGDNSNSKDAGIWGLWLNGWRSRVAADPQFPFKVLMEQLVGVTACVIGDMASRPNFGLNELDFVFSTLVVGSIMNFTLMYLLAPTLSASPQNLPGLFASCPTSHMFEPGAFSFANRLGTFVFKGLVFASVGFAAGLVGTAISNGLIKLRKKMDPAFETPNKPPPTVLNALTWSLHMGISSNFRYQTLNGIEFLLAKSTPEVVFKSSVVVLRCLNNVLGGMSFVLLARMTGSQSVSADKAVAAAETGSAEEKQKLVDHNDEN